ncbi:MAG: aldehyde dehydrogenase family protein [Nocardiopsaceae bacterium]|nr:aldehyde dehydrogenase family protein [Nocardiopsaceae bacterium]
MSGNATVPGADQARVTETITALRESGARWARRPVDERINVLLAWREQLETHRTDLVDALAKATGRLPISNMEVDSVLAGIDRCARWGRELIVGDQHRPNSNPDVALIQAPVPLGVVGAIAPWNFPLQLALIDAVPALIAGCTVVVKPSELTPDFVPVLQQTIAAVPELAEVLAIIEGGPKIGQQIVAEADAVCFTGSVDTGRAVAAAAAARFIPAFLELGGKDAAIVTAGADLDVASAGILWGSTANTGQSCMSLERVYVERPVADEFTDRLLSRAAKVTVAYDGPGTGDIGRFIDPRQADVVTAQIEDAVAKGAQVRTGGTVTEHNGAFFLPPTVLTHVDHSMRVLTEETFGPVIPVMAVDSADEAVELANATDYGLSAAVFGPREQALAIAGRLFAGGVSINDVCLTGMVPEGEKQAFKNSGLGPSRMGPESITRFLHKRVLLQRRQPRIQPWWYTEEA